MDINYFDGDKSRSKIANLFIYAKKRRQHRKLLYETLKTIQPDVVISVGTSEKYMLLAMKRRSWKLIREFHFDRHYRMRLAKTMFDKVMAWVADKYDFGFKEKNMIALLSSPKRIGRLTGEGGRMFL